MALATVVLGGLMLLCGLPFALALRRPRDGWVAAGVDALLLGVVALPLAVTLWAWWGVAGAVLPAAAWCAAAVAVLRRGRAGLPPAPARPGRDGAARGVLWCGVLVAAALLRLRQVEFVPWVGDMGAYVNWANELVRTGALEATWPPLLPAYLAVGGALLGTAHTTAGMALVGLVLVLALARLAQQVGVGPWAVLAAGAVVAVHGHAVWFATFPASESLAAPFLVVWLLTVHRALTAPTRAARWPHVLAGGVVVVALCLLRANGPLLLVPVLAVLVAVLAVPAWRRFAGAWSGVSAAAVAGSAAGYWYGVAVIPAYYVDMQLPLFLPARALAVLGGLGVLDGTARTAGLLLAVVAVVCAALPALGARVARRAAASPVPPSRRSETAVLLAAAVALAGLLAVLAVQDGDVWRIAGRLGVWLCAAGVLGAATARWLPDEAARPVLLVAVATVLLYLVLQDARLGEPREHAFYLYWDRYLVSEVLPCLVLLGAVALHQGSRAVAAGLRRLRVGRPAGAVAAPVAVAATVAVVVWAAPGLRHANGDAFLRGARAFAEDLADVALAQGAPVVWAAAGDDEIADYFFPNTWMAFAVPLAVTWGLDVADLDVGDFEPDVPAGEGRLRRVATCADGDELTVLEVDRGGPGLAERLDGSDIAVTHLGRVRGSWRVLPQRHEPDEWRTVAFEVDAWRATVPAALQRLPYACGDGAVDGGAGAARQQPR
ncbi:hypothetical protein MHY85_12655 [Cellulomonas sp. ACRRI]|uniref:hypothetical protein n=1 Tax=Cellulomonas sp. ACRRI TaxID=2918188 RepID=UPI001EF16925|nr:hypothetical protein [Cellulomonas sp. ACRRI]MCG7286820.1 hypothetical protein [Cellulomonas sp. ACRRI]